MKLRTVLGELGVTAHLEGDGVDLEADLFPTLGTSELAEALVMAPEGAREPDPSYAGITLLYAGSALPAAPSHAPTRSVLVASADGYDLMQSRFARLPELNTQLSIKQKRLYHAFEVSYDVQRFADLAFAVLKNPLIVVNTDHRLLASAGEFPKSRMDVLDEIVQGYVFEEVNAELEAAGIIDDVRHAGHSIIAENKYGQRWVTSIITYHHMEMGRLDLLEKDQHISYVDLELIDFAGSLVGIIIDKLGQAGKRAGSGSSVLDDILGNALANERTLRAQLALSSMPLDDTYVVAILAGERDLPRSHVQRIAARITHAFRHSLWTMRDGRLVVLVAIGARTCPGWDCYGRCERVLSQRKEFVTTLERNGLTAFVAEPFEQLSLASVRYAQAKALMDTCSAEKGKIVYFWDHRYRVLASSTTTFGQADIMLDKRVVAMSLYDRDHGTQYLETSRMTVAFPGSPADAAKALNVHRNTYFYRVNKINELFFIDLRNGNDRLAVAFSTQVLDSMGGTVLFDVGQMPETWRRATGNA